LQVFVRDNNVEQALRVLKKKMPREGVFREMKRRRFFEKTSEKSTREKAEAVPSCPQARTQAGAARRPAACAEKAPGRCQRRRGASGAHRRLTGPAMEVIR